MRRHLNCTDQVKRAASFVKPDPELRTWLLHGLAQGKGNRLLQEQHGKKRRTKTALVLPHGLLPDAILHKK